MLQNSSALPLAVALSLIQTLSYSSLTISISHSVATDLFVLGLCGGFLDAFWVGLVVTLAGLGFSKLTNGWFLLLIGVFVIALWMFFRRDTLVHVVLSLLEAGRVFLRRREIMEPANDVTSTRFWIVLWVDVWRRNSPCYLQSVGVDSRLVRSKTENATRSSPKWRNKTYSSFIRYFVLLHSQSGQERRTSPKKPAAQYWLNVTLLPRSDCSKHYPPCWPSPFLRSMCRSLWSVTHRYARTWQRQINLKQITGRFFTFPEYKSLSKPRWTDPFWLPGRGTSSLTLGASLRESLRDGHHTYVVIWSPYWLMIFSVGCSSTMGRSFSTGQSAPLPVSPVDSCIQSRWIVVDLLSNVENVYVCEEKE